PGHRLPAHKALVVKNLREKTIFWQKNLRGKTILTKKNLREKKNLCIFRHVRGIKHAEIYI
ncbi:MAG: hypothetical protein IJ734_05340, partial [Fibrobacter sp.]|nr:hypothetical protein [Fibrobacter sp.]